MSHERARDLGKIDGILTCWACAVAPTTNTLRTSCGCGERGNISARYWPRDGHKKATRSSASLCRAYGDADAACQELHTFNRPRPQTTRDEVLGRDRD
jgi:hypothetical protein